MFFSGGAEFPAVDSEGERLREEAYGALEDPTPAAAPVRRPPSPALFFDGEPAKMSSTQQTRLALLRKMFPTLSDWPAEVLLAESVGSLSTAHGNLEARSGRDHRPTLDTRLSHNFKDLASKEISLPEGKDNLVDKLHGGRFLPGPLCSLTAVWMEARKHVPERGLTQYAHYDVKTVGLGNRVSSKAWACLHDPGSVDLTINLFLSPAAAAGPARGGADVIPEGLDNFKLALSVARVAQQMVTPWNFSITTIQLFLETTKFGQRQFNNQKEHVHQLAAFVNDCLLTNAKNWQLGQPFMDVGALTSQWAVLTAGRPVAGTGGAGKFQSWSEKRKRSPSPQKKQQYKGGDEAAGRAGICIRYNQDRCTNSADNCSFRGVKLRHVCNVSLPGGRRCERRHPRGQHR